MNEIHKKEFETVKNLAKEVDFFFPYNPKKPIFLQTDGSKSGLGYLLYIDGDKEAEPAAEAGAETTKKKKHSDAEWYPWEQPDSHQVSKTGQYSTWVYQRPVNILESISRCQTPVRNNCY